MSEKILNALMQLFAIITRVDSGQVIGRNVVENFLRSQLPSALVDTYLKVFDDYVESIHNLSDPAKSQKKLSTNSVKVLRICTEINKELTQAQKFVVLLRLFEYINANGNVTDQEHEFVRTVSDTFNIDEAEYKICFNFCNCDEPSLPDHERFLSVSANDTTPANRHWLHADTLNGTILVLHIASVNMYVFRYFGKMDIYLNGQSITPGKVFLLTPGSSIRSTKLQPVYYSDITGRYMAAGNEERISFAVNDLEFRFKSGKIGLHTLNLFEESGTLVGIMGGSGAGKSTVLNILNGNEKPFSGSVTVNGINIHTEPGKIEGVIGHVPQDDLLIEELSVFQNLFYAAKLCFGNLSDEAIKERVLTVLANLGLSETADLKVGSPLEKTISGGQRKRLNIGLELIREPALLFVDEPTSGLSSRDSENIMDLLKELTLRGKLVFVVIHQPSSDIFKMFDKLLILDLGGYPIYYGNPVDSVIYFKKHINHANASESECITCGNVNPEQVFSIIESKVLDEYGNVTSNRKVAPKEWNDIYHKEIPEKEKKNNTGAIPTGSFSIPGKLKQFMVFVTRDVLSKLANKQYMYINFLETPVLGFILAGLVRFYNTDINNTIGYKYSENENIAAYMLMAVVIALFVGLTVAAEEIIRDRKILKRESFLNLSRGSYLFSKIAILFVISAIQTISFVLIGNSILGIQDMHFSYWLVLFTTSCFANMLGLNISASFNSAVTIYILIPFLIIPQLLLSGVIVKFDKLNPLVTSQTEVPIVGEMMASRWAYEAIAVNQFRNNNFNKDLYIYDKTSSLANFRKDFWLPEIRKKVEECENILNGNGKKEQLEYNLGLLYREVSRELNSPSAEHAKFSMLEQLKPGAFTMEVSAAMRKYMDDLNKFYIKLFKVGSSEKDKIVSPLNRTEELHQAYLKLERENSNENLNDLLTARTDARKIVEHEGVLIQRADPIYMDPPKGKFLRAHFFAPRKWMGSTYVDTYWVNIMVIWFMTLVLGITLYFDGLRKTLKAFTRLGGGRSRRS